MKLVQLLLPAKPGTGSARDTFECVLAELTDSFGGATASVQVPARDLWSDPGEIQHDRVVLVEVMVDIFETDWWSVYRKSLEDMFAEKEIFVRALPVENV